jgi:WD40 repeat protein
MLVSKYKFAALGLSLLLLAALTLPSAGQEVPVQPPQEEVKDRLPTGALARMGTIRFRHGSRILSMAFAPDGKSLAVGAGDDHVRLWDVPSGKELHPGKLKDTWVYAVAFSRDGRTLASGSGFKTIRLWSVATGAEIRQLQGHNGAVKAVAFSPDGTLLASG